MPLLEVSVYEQLSGIVLHVEAVSSCTLTDFKVLAKQSLTWLKNFRPPTVGCSCAVL